MADRRRDLAPRDNPQQRQQMGDLQRGHPLTLTETRAELHIGPLPPPEILAEYEDILPGMADRIVTMAEQNSAHRHHLEKVVIEGDVRRANLGLWAGLIVTLAALAAAYFIATTGNQWAASIIGVGGIATLAGTFVYGTERRKKERQEKAESRAMSPEQKRKRQ